MRNRLTFLVSVATLIFSTLTAFAESSAQAERIEASFVLAIGRLPAPAEVADDEKLGQLTVTELVARRRQELQGDAALKRATVVKAWSDAFGRAPTEGEIVGSISGNYTYTELMKRHIQWLAEHPS